MNLRRLLIDVILAVTLGASVASARTGGGWIVDGQPGTKEVRQEDVAAGDAGVSNALIAAQAAGAASLSNALVEAYRVWNAAFSNVVWAVFQPANSNLADLADGMLSKSKVQDSGHWDAAYGWGNHATNGYLTNYHGSVGFSWGSDTGSVGNVFYSARFDDPCTLTNLAAVIRNGGSARIDLRYHADWGLTNCTVLYTGLVVGGVATNLSFNQALAVGSGLSLAATNGAWTNMSINASYTGKNQ
jgi:hypothetical protein